MTSCNECSKGEYHGLPPAGSPDWEVGTVYFWCPERRHHDQFAPACNLYNEGEPKLFDKRGVCIERADDDQRR